MLRLARFRQLFSESRGGVTIVGQAIERLFGWYLKSALIGARKRPSTWTRSDSMIHT